jgi:hypothetical protein
MPITQLYHTWIQQILELHPDERMTRVRNFAWLMIGIYKSRSVHLSKIAGKIPGQAKLVSITRRLSRFLDNPAVRVRGWYEPLARRWLQAQHSSLKEIRLIVDGTKVGFAHQLLMVSIAYRRRAIPIAWTWVKHVKGHSPAGKQIALLNYVKQLLPAKTSVFLVGDTEFGAIKVLKQLEQWRWYYVLRQKGSTKIWTHADQDWVSFSTVIERVGQSVWLGTAYLTESSIHPVNLLAHWKVGEKEAWLLATNLPDKQLALAFYKRRMWIEEMFGDLKGHGFDLEASMLHSFLRLSRLTLAVAFLYLWAVTIGTQTIHRGQRHIVDRNERRDLSIFQIGLRFIERRITNSLSVPVSTCTYR